MGGWWVRLNTASQKMQSPQAKRLILIRDRQGAHKTLIDADYTLRIWLFICHIFTFKKGISEVNNRSIRYLLNK
jgi:hypothetical protein